jgi:hypothetical protein
MVQINPKERDTEPRNQELRFVEKIDGCSWMV